jgi:hypothetical protein
MGELVPPEQGKRTDKEPVRISDKFPDKQRLSEFRKLAKISLSTVSEKPYRLDTVPLAVRLFVGLLFRNT